MLLLPTYVKEGVDTSSELRRRTNDRIQRAARRLMQDITASCMICLLTIARWPRSDFEVRWTGMIPGGAIKCCCFPGCRQRRFGRNTVIANRRGGSHCALLASTSVALKGMHRGMISCRQDPTESMLASALVLISLGRWGRGRLVRQPRRVIRSLQGLKLSLTWRILGATTSYWHVVIGAVKARGMIKASSECINVIDSSLQANPVKVLKASAALYEGPERGRLPLLRQKSSPAAHSPPS